MNRTMFIGTNLYYSQEFVDDRINELKEKDKEIERLNNLVKGLREERDYLFNKTTTESNYEIERLNNIINEFDKWLENEIKFQEIVENAHFLRKARIKLQELKGSNKNE